MKEPTMEILARRLDRVEQNNRRLKRVTKLAKAFKVKVGELVRGNNGF